MGQGPRSLFIGVNDKFSGIEYVFYQGVKHSVLEPGTKTKSQEGRGPFVFSVVSPGPCLSPVGVGKG